MIEYIQVIVALCAIGTPVDECRGINIIRKLYGPIVKNEMECQRDGMTWLSDQTTKGLKIKNLSTVLYCQPTQFKYTMPDYGKVQDATDPVILNRELYK